MFFEEKLLLIVLTDSVAKKIEKSARYQGDINDDLSNLDFSNPVAEKIEKSAQYQGDVNDDLSNLDNICLFYYKTKKDEDANTEGMIALPFNDGKNVLLLKKDKTDNYFIAVGFWDRRKTNIKDPNHHELPSHVKCQLLDTHCQDLKKYASDAVDHDKIWEEVIQKKIWRYNESSTEDRKWHAYFDLYKKIIDKQKVNFSLQNIAIKKDKLFADCNNDDETKAKITDARGEDIKFSLSEAPKKSANRHSNHADTLGKLSAVHTKIEINISKDFKKNTKNSLKTKKTDLL